MPGLGASAGTEVPVGEYGAGDVEAANRRVVGGREAVVALLVVDGVEGDGFRGDEGVGGSLGLGCLRGEYFKEENALSFQPIVSSMPM